MKTQKKLTFESLNNEYLKPLTRNELYRVQGGTTSSGASSTTAGSSGTTFGDDLNQSRTLWTDTTYTTGGYSTFEPGDGGMSDVGSSSMMDRHECGCDANIPLLRDN